MPRKRSDTFFTALNRAADALIELLEQGNRRGYRVSRRVLREARRGGPEVLAIVKEWSEHPTDVLRWYEVQLVLQTRALEVVRDLMGEMRGARRDVRQALQRMIIANIAAGQAFAGAARPRRTAVGRGRPAKAVRSRAAARRAAASGGYAATVASSRAISL